MWQSLLEWDRSLLLWLNGDWGWFWDQFFFVVSSKLIWAPFYAVVLYAVWRRFGTRNLLLTMLCLGLAVIAADQVCNFFKEHTPKFRPTHTESIRHLVHTVRDYRGGLYGTVSAHAAIGFTIAFFTSRLFRRRWYTAVVYLWALLVAYSRIYLGVHFPLDIFFGALCGTLLGWAAFRIYRKLERPVL